MYRNFLNSLPTSRLLWLWVFALFALRFCFLGDTLFIADEPLFQLKIDQAFATGSIPLTSFRGSSIPLPYGAGGIWFYLLPRLFFWHPYVLVFYHALAMTLGALLFLWTIRRAYGGEAARWAGVLVASSPLLFFYSRHSWDNTLLLPVGAVALWGLHKLDQQKHEAWIHALLGVITAYALNVHLMFGPVAVALGLTLLWRGARLYGLRSMRFWTPLLAFGLAAIVVMIPYLVEAFRIMGVEQPLENTKFTKRWGDARNLWWLFQRTVIFSSVWGSRIYLEEVRAQFFAFVGQPLAFFFHIDLFGWFSKLAAWFTALVYPIQYLRGRVGFDPLRIFAFLSFALLLLIYQFLNIPTAPHYFEPVWWFVFLGVAITVTQLRARAKTIFLGLLVATALVNTAYDLSVLRYVHVNKGARNLSFSVVVSEQIRAVSEICVEAAARIPPVARVEIGEAYISGSSFVYLPAHLPECKGVKFEAARKIDAPNFRLRHPGDSETKADLIVDWL